MHGARGLQAGGCWSSWGALVAPPQLQLQACWPPPRRGPAQKHSHKLSLATPERTGAGLGLGPKGGFIFLLLLMGPPASVASMKVALMSLSTLQEAPLPPSLIHSHFPPFGNMLLAFVATRRTSPLSRVLSEDEQESLSLPYGSVPMTGFTEVYGVRRPAYLLLITTSDTGFGATSASVFPHPCRSLYFQALWGS